MIPSICTIETRNPTHPRKQKHSRIQMRMHELLPPPSRARPTPAASLLALFLSALLLAGCGTTQAPPPEGPGSGSGGDKAGAGAGAAAPASAAEGSDETAAAQQAATAPPVTDLSGEVMLTVTVGSIDAILNQGVAYVQPHLPSAFRHMVRPETLKSQLFQALRLPGLERTIDTTRPAALALVDPRRHRGSQLGPVLVALPVKAEEKLTEVVGQRAERHERTPYGDHLFTFGSSTIRVRFANGYAFAAEGEALINGAAGVLMPLVQRQPGAKGRLRVDLDAINARYGGQVERAIAKLRRKMNRKSIEQASAMQMVARWMGYLKGIKELTVELDLEPAALRLQGAVAAKPDGGFADYLRQQSAGPAWGARFIPKESGLVYLSRRNPTEAVRSLDETLGLMAGALKEVVPAASITRFRALIAESARHYSGEAAMGLWVNADGGVGAGGVARVKDSAAARASLLKLTQLVSQQLNRVMAKGLPPRIKRQLQGFDLRLRVRPGGLRLGNVRADLAEVTVKWPRPKDPEARRAMAQLKKKVLKVLGPRLPLAVAYHGEVAAWAGGKDHRRRLAKMLAIAKGGAGTGVEQTIKPYLAGKRVIDYLYVPVASLAEQVMRLVESLITVPAELKNAFHGVMPGPGKVVPVSAALHVSGSSLRMDVDVSPDLVGMMAKGGVMAFTRMGRRRMPPPGP